MVSHEPDLDRDLGMALQSRWCFKIEAENRLLARSCQSLTTLVEIELPRSLIVYHTWRKTKEWVWYWKSPNTNCWSIWAFPSVCWAVDGWLASEWSRTTHTLVLREVRLSRRRDSQTSTQTEGTRSTSRPDHTLHTSTVFALRRHVDPLPTFQTKSSACTREDSSHLCHSPSSYHLHTRFSSDVKLLYFFVLFIRIKILQNQTKFKRAHVHTHTPTLPTECQNSLRIALGLLLVSSQEIVIPGTSVLLAASGQNSLDYPLIVNVSDSG